MEYNVNDMRVLACAMPEEVKYYQYSGDFAGERACIDRYLAKKNLPEVLRRRLILEKAIAGTMNGDYDLTEADFVAIIKKHHPLFTLENLRELTSYGNVDFILRNGIKYYQRQAPDNVLGTYAFYLRHLDEPGKEEETAVNEWCGRNHAIMKKQGYRAFRYTVEEWLYPNKENLRPGKRLRVWLPFPTACASQSDIRLLSSSHPAMVSDALHRTAMLETVCKENDRCSVEFTFVNRAVYQELDANAVSADQPTFCTEEFLPHIQFTPFMRALAKEIAGNETNPLKMARRVYDWITENVRYSYLRDYFCMENIPQFVALNGHGDCGAMGLTFITLCRILGIPARWQSGSSITPASIGNHDWTMFYVAPYGWLYCDPSYGVTAHRHNDKQMLDHYFGNLDPFRLVACDDVQQPFAPDKKFFRMDPYDNQTGEAEYEDENLFFGQTDYGRRVISGEEITD